MYKIHNIFPSVYWSKQYSAMFVNIPYNPGMFIYDDIFPYKLSVFRYIEFIYYLSQTKPVKIFIDGSSFSAIDKYSPKIAYSKSIQLFKTTYSRFANNIVNLAEKRKRFIFINSNTAYCVFLANAYKIIDLCEHLNLQLSFCLYPGGGFSLNSEGSDRMLRRIFTSPVFNFVIVTQQLTKDYLINKCLCDPNRIKFIFGGVADKKLFSFDNKLQYKKTKQTIDVCFMAFKYDEDKDKGFSVFRGSCLRLLKEFPDLHVHLIGGYSDMDFDADKSVSSRVHYYGYQDKKFFATFLNKIDIFVSPNFPRKKNYGSFDGFPLGTCLLAGINGCLVISTDVYNENHYFKNNQEIVIIQPVEKELYSKLKELFGHPRKIYEIAKKGQVKFEELYSSKIQLKPRLNLLFEES